VKTIRYCESDVWKLCKNDSDSRLESLIVIRVESFGEKHGKSRVTKDRDSSHAITAL